MAFVVDTFTDTAGISLASHTGETGATWTLHSSYATGAATISNANRVYGSSTSHCWYASGTPATAEYDVDVDWDVITSPTVSVEVVAGRISTSANTMYFVRYNKGTSNFELFKIVAGTSTSLGTYNLATAPGDTHTVKLEIRDATKKVYIDTVERISSTDNAITAAGRVGFRGVNNASNTTGYHIDSITASDVGGGAQGVTAGTIASTAAVYSPTLAPGAVTVALETVAASTAVASPTITSVVTVAPATLASTATLFAPTLAPGAVTLALDTIAAATSFFAPTVNAGEPEAQALALGTIGAASTLFPPTVTPGVVVITPAVLSLGSQVFALTLAPGAVTIVPGFRASTAVVFAPRVGALILTDTPASRMVSVPIEMRRTAVAVEDRMATA